MVTTGQYILEGKHPVLCPDLLTWARWFEKAERHVAQDVWESVRVSTVFLGMNHSFVEGPPLLFESMIFGGALDGECERCSTWEEAEAMHQRLLERVKAGKAA